LLSETKDITYSLESAYLIKIDRRNKLIDLLRVTLIVSRLRSLSCTQEPHRISTIHHMSGHPWSQSSYQAEPLIKLRNMFDVVHN
jgi:hypothetical protein